MIEYLFGSNRRAKFVEGLNHILLEFKIFIFYNSADWENENAESTLKRFICILKRLMVKEKLIAIRKNKYEIFIEKWDRFSGIYDFRGPDIEMII